MKYIIEFYRQHMGYYALLIAGLTLIAVYLIKG